MKSLYLDGKKVKEAYWNGKKWYSDAPKEPFPEPYTRWSYCDQIMNHNTLGSQSNSFCNYKYVDGVWTNDLDIIYTADSSNMFSDEFIKKAGKSLFRFGNLSSETVLPTSITINHDISFGGIYVVDGSSFTIQQSGNYSRRTNLGIAGKESWFVMKHLNGVSSTNLFTINRRYTNLKIYGMANFVLKGGIFHCNYMATSFPTIIDDSTANSGIRFFREDEFSRFHVSTLDATGNVTLDFSNLESIGTYPMIYGSLKISDSTKFCLPAFVTENTPHVLCSETLMVSGETTRVAEITVGTETFIGTITFDTTNKTISYSRI